MGHCKVILSSLVSAVITLSVLPVYASDTPAARLMTKAADKYAAGQQSVAREIWKLVVKDYSTSPEAAQAQLKLVHLTSIENPKQTLSEYESLISKFPNSPEAVEALHYKADSLAKSGDEATALKIYLSGYDLSKKFTSNQKPNDSDACYVDAGVIMLNRAASDQKELQINQALKWLTEDAEKIVTSADELSKARLAVAQYYLYYVKDAEKATKLLNEASSDAKTKMAPAIKYELAYVPYSQGNYQQCLSQLKTVVAEGIPDKHQEAIFSYLIGDCYARMGDKASAKAVWEAMIKKYPGTEFPEICRKTLEVLEPVKGDK